MLRVEEVMWNWGGMGRDIGLAEQVPKILTNHRAGEAGLNLLMPVNGSKVSH